MKSHTTPLILIAGSILFLAAILLMKPTDTAFGGAFTGSAAYLQIATSSALTANTNKVILAARTDGACKSRVVTVPGSVTGGINLIFGDTTNGNISSTTLSSSIGHYQAASTTETYDGELFGCGMMVARSWTTGTITVSEF